MFIVYSIYIHIVDYRRVITITDVVYGREIELHHASEYSTDTGIIQIQTDPLLDVSHIAEDRRVLDDTTTPAPGV